ncbi:MAG: hypothetical protein IT379_40630 [Deltaproteobacteria bacterium]|nr:hypothetical protein [Deltaproteobacteria bacterium]
MLDGARRVETLCGVAAITAGQLHTCALDPYGAVWCWGANHLGQLGDETMRVSAAPRRVSGLP